MTCFFTGCTGPGRLPLVPRSKAPGSRPRCVQLFSLIRSSTHNGQTRNRRGCFGGNYLEINISESRRGWGDEEEDEDTAAPLQTTCIQGRRRTGRTSESIHQRSEMERENRTTPQLAPDQQPGAHSFARSLARWSRGWMAGGREGRRGQKDGSDVRR